MKEFEPSKYQLDIYDEIANGSGNIVVEAAAGSGKTTTIIECIKRIPSDKSILLTAFNRSICFDLMQRVKEFPNVTCNSIYSIAYTMLRSEGYMRDFKYKVPYDDLTISNLYKYSNEFRDNRKKYTTIDPYRLGKGGRDKYYNNLEKYIKYARLYMATSMSDMFFIRKHYDITDVCDEMKVVLKLLEWGSSVTNVGDFEDMVWLPVRLNIEDRLRKYDFVFVDECQDISPVQRRIVLSSCKPDGGRMMFVGDSNQSIYAFNGADPNGFDCLKKLPNTKTLPLSISYRCSDNVVKFASRFGRIEPNNDKRRGSVVYDMNLDNVKSGDMILCRNNAPLFKVCIDLINRGIPTYIFGGSEGGENELARLVKKSSYEYLCQDLECKGVFSELYESLFREIRTMIRLTGFEEKKVFEMREIQERIDNINALLQLSEGLTTRTELYNKIVSFVSNEKKDGVSLSTVHKAKGLEADNVYILCDSLMPSKSAQLDWEVVQEKNLRYVAYTRSKENLYFIDERLYNPNEMFGNNSLSELKDIEEKIKSIPKDVVSQPAINFKKKVVVKRNDKPKVVQKSLFGEIIEIKNKGKRRKRQ